MIIGLGNPGQKYKHTYHNAGAMMVDFLSKKLAGESGLKKSKRNALFEGKEISGLALVAPLTYMNESGKAVKMAIKSFKIKPQSIMVAHDDSDIALGDYKMSFGKNSAGHRGVESVIQSLGTKDFWRLRIGVRPEASRDQRRGTRKKAGEFVLRKISSGDRKILNSVFERASEEIFERII